MTYKSDLLTLSPVAYWPLDETSGSVADNAEGTAAIDGTFHSSIVLDDDTGPFDSDPAAKFSAGGVDIFSEALEDVFGYNEGSVSLWFKEDGVSNSGYLFQVRDNGSNYLFFRAVNDIIVKRRADAINSEGQYSLNDVDAWNHIAATWSVTNDAFIVYLNGVAQTTKTGLIDWRTFNNFDDGHCVIGAFRADNQSTPFNGYIQHVACFDKVLTASEITSLNTGVFSSGNNVTISSSLSLSSEMNKHTNKNLVSNGLSISSTLLKKTEKQVYSSLSLTSTLLKQTIKTISTTLNLLGSLTKQASKQLNSNLILTSTLRRLTSKKINSILLLSTTLSSILNGSQDFSVLISSNLSLTSTLSKSTFKKIQSNLNLISILVKSTSKKIAATLNITGSLASSIIGIHVPTIALTLRKRLTNLTISRRSKNND